MVLLVADTQVKHDIGDGGYAAGASSASRPPPSWACRPCATLTPQQVAGCAAQGTLRQGLMRARHVVGEIDRTLEAVEALEARRLARFGQLMYGSARSAARRLRGKLRGTGRDRRAGRGVQTACTARG